MWWYETIKTKWLRTRNGYAWMRTKILTGTMSAHNWHQTNISRPWEYNSKQDPQIPEFSFWWGWH